MALNLLEPSTSKTADMRSASMKRGVLFVLLLSVVVTLAAAPAHAVRRDVIINKCKEAGGLLISQGVKAVAKIIDDTEGIFVWNNKVNYLFLMDINGKMIAHPFKPGLKNQETLFGLKDINGKAFIVDFVKVAKTEVGMGWVNYMWPLPGKEKPIKKSTFIYRIPGTDYFVGSGFYVIKAGEYY